MKMPVWLQKLLRRHDVYRLESPNGDVVIETCTICNRTTIWWREVVVADRIGPIEHVIFEAADQVSEPEAKNQLMILGAQMAEAREEDERGERNTEPTSILGNSN